MVQAWEKKLESYKKDSQAGYTEIDRAKKVYEAKKAAGDMSGAEAAHTWANQIRDAMGISHLYDRDTGAPLSQVKPVAVMSGVAGGIRYNDDLRRPDLPRLKLQYPAVPAISYDEAYQRAGGILDPQTELSRIETLEAYQRQQQQLPKYLNARGQLWGGLRVGGETELTQSQARDLDKLRLYAAAEKARMAQMIKEGDEDKARETADRMYQALRDQANLKWQQYQAQLESYIRARDKAEALALRLLEVEESLKG